MWKSWKMRAVRFPSPYKEDKYFKVDYRIFAYDWRSFFTDFLLALCLDILLAWFFYRSFWPMIPLAILSFGFFLKLGEKRGEKRRRQLNFQFRDMILSVTASLQTGYSVENAFLEAEKEMTGLHGKDAVIVRELTEIKKGLGNNVSLEKLLLDLGERSGVEEIQDFVDIFCISKRSGGNLRGIIKQSAEITDKRMQVEEEIETMLASRALEQRILNAAPFFLLTYMQLVNPGFFDMLYHNPAGICVMTVCLVLYLTAAVMAEKIVKISV